MNIRPALLASLATTLLLPACTTTTLTASWADAKYAQRPVPSIMVLGIAASQSNRRLYEDTLVTQLRGAGVEAVPSYTELPGEEKPDRPSLEKAIQSTGVAAVLVTRVLMIEDETRYQAARQYYPDHYGGMYSYYPGVYASVSEPGYYTSYKVYRLESNLYDSVTAKLIWSAQTETLEPDNLAREIDALVRMLIKDLQSKALI